MLSCCLDSGDLVREKRRHTTLRYRHCNLFFMFQETFLYTIIQFYFQLVLKTLCATILLALNPNLQLFLKIKIYIFYSVHLLPREQKGAKTTAWRTPHDNGFRKMLANQRLKSGYRIFSTTHFLSQSLIIRSRTHP